MQIFRQSDGKVMRFLGSLVKESPEETEHVFAVDDIIVVVGKNESIQRFEEHLV